MKASRFAKKYLHWLVVGGVMLLCTLFIIFGHTSENGQYRTLDGNDAKIPEATTRFIEDSEAAMNRIMNQDRPTDESTMEANDEIGKGFYTTLEDVLSRQLLDGNNDNGRGWQCSRYTAWLGTGQWSYSSSHPDYGPVNGKDVTEWLKANYGYKDIDKPVRGAIGSGGFNTLYGHTVMYLYDMGDGIAMVNDANYTPLTVSTHPMDITGWKWVVPGSYEPEPTPEPTPQPTPQPEQPSKELTYSYVPGNTFGQVLLDTGLSDPAHLWGAGGDVEYYTKQLVEQNMLDAHGNVILYVPFTLTRK